ncbi:sigma factor-like helix-turn-helix DNA-binding protein [Gordonia insulae]|uniref:RNA polymerase sigma factor RpoH n=1 Tax=Gordonia insulae TaxID=2420509 RepID=A0A3G8JK93_9ACTN|nr:sigma factor-like helix-turn-helix DNA-binding protein [Gordonia insulae]AZG45045.1 RNA polymerase sigma factor RpoH [Gordonia insulae]
MSPSSEVLTSAEATVPDDEELAERLRGETLSERPWIELLPWLAEYRQGPGLLADDEIVVNAWIPSSPAETLTDANQERFCHRIAERYVADRPSRTLIDDFPQVRAGAEPLPLPRAAREALTTNGVDTIAELMTRSVGDIGRLPGIGPITLVNLVARLVARSAVIHADPSDSAVPADAELRAFLTSLSERDRLVLYDRILASRPRTQSELAGMLGTSRERVTQIDRGLRQRLARSLAATPGLRALEAEMIRRADPVIEIDSLMDDFPTLGTSVGEPGIPLWHLLTAAAPNLIAVDDWIIRGTLKAVAAATRATVDSLANPEDLAPIQAVADRLGLSLESTRRWLRRSGYAFLGDHAIPSTASTGDLVAAYLSTADASQTFDEIVAGLTAFPRAPSSIRNALVSDDRIVKTDRNSYGLQRWGMQQYVPVHVQIDRILAAARGPVALATVIDEITGAYEVTEASVRAYASAGDFVTRDDMVMRRTRPYSPRKSPTRTRGLYRDGDTIHWSTTATAAHVKGSAFNLPSALAGIVGIAPGTPVQLATRHGPQSFMWVSVQARSGTIKRFITELGLAEGDPIVLDFMPGRFDVRAADVDATGSPTSQILARLGRPRRGRVSKAAISEILQESLWLPDADAGSIVATLRQRKEFDLADLVESVLR